MHELSLCERLLELLEEQSRRHAFHRVTRIKLAVGQFACVDPDALRFAFDVIRRDTLADGATVDIHQPPGLVWCEDCAREREVPTRIAPCPACGGLRLTPRGGDDLTLVELEVA
ncbi:[NiFe] hydrogenase nickel incorporation protein HypA [Azospirillum argentinense]|uniref:Hydrogenase maturation factor HypA n=2 Tax=Azospirillum TaxID=191 RepID=A0A5B0KYZ5_9PROT|nr:MULTISPECIES: hydrogenase maturation nickel metallochaperone HypA [Azospirillum]AIB14839.1 hydrogenase nickel incorporation protein HypA [Azospirillum argentinense]EZQ04346.1 hydrogenase nickel incorporation protein HypA [Azospirillum argentinense]KAA1057339.1 [NiFe] hydrogenase nickel incorporation protein HypA [Azospirillum argentinense]MBK3798148.1 hydrogenase maturation nickel metallochaperone HypA [Azospirillum argentinense]PNQ97483.1 hydrogenase maturation nickel metallochaperone HypA